MLEKGFRGTRGGEPSEQLGGNLTFVQNMGSVLLLVETAKSCSLEAQRYFHTFAGKVFPPASFDKNRQHKWVGEYRQVLP